MLQIHSSPVHRPNLAARAAASSASPAPAASVAAGPSESSELSAVPAKIANVPAASVAAIEAELDGHEFVEGELLVKLRAGTGLSQQDKIASEFGGIIVERFDIPKDIFKNFDGELVRMKVPHGISVSEALAAMKDDSRVIYAEPNDVIYLDETENGETSGPDDLDEKLWGLNNTGQRGGVAGADISALEAWETTVGSRENGPLIAVIDTGVDYNHPDLDANVWTNPGEIPGDGIDNDGNGVVDDVRGYNAFADNGDPMDGHSHGTHCAGTIGAVGNNGEGVVGVNHEATILPVKIFSDSGRTTADAIVRGILYSGRMGADITSNSWGGGRANNAIRDAFANNPALHIAAAGNSNSDNDRRPHYPSNYELDNMVAVAATNRNDQRASFSCYGETTVDVAAPGRDIWSTIPGGRYGNKSGTSMATPHVSGVAGLIATAHPEASNDEIKNRLIHSSDKISALNNISVSDGRVNAARAVESDTVAPGSPNDFAVVSSDSRGATLNWTAPGDDGWCGETASGFEIRMSDQPITPDNWGETSAVTVLSEGRIGEIQSHDFSVAPQEGETQLHFALQSLDNVGNRSELRTTMVTLPGVSEAFGDNFDGAESAWTADGTWDRVDVEGRGKVWTDSPDGNYQDNANQALTSPVIDLSGRKNALLRFDSKQSLSWGDKALVQVRVEGSEEWTTLNDLPRNSDWAAREIDLADFSGDKIQVRFQMESNSRTNSDGVYVDNFRILAEE